VSGLVFDHHPVIIMPSPSESMQRQFHVQGENMAALQQCRRSHVWLSAALKPCIGLVAALLVGAEEQPASFLDVTVDNVRSDHGRVRVAVCTEREFLSMHCSWIGSAPAQPGAVTVRVAGIPPGVYAVEAYQDENENRQIDRNLIGMPIEGIGFSRDARFRFGPPRFADAAVTLGPDGGQIRLSLRYLAG
jgi:uncharacterized protein (DUF2141 family)